jgi:hypothetical protein
LKYNFVYISHAGGDKRVIGLIKGRLLTPVGVQNFEPLPHAIQASELTHKQNKN